MKGFEGVGIDLCRVDSLHLEIVALGCCCPIAPFGPSSFLAFESCFKVVDSQPPLGPDATECLYRGNSRGLTTHAGRKFMQ